MNPPEKVENFDFEKLPQDVKIYILFPLEIETLVVLPLVSKSFQVFFILSIVTVYSQRRFLRRAFWKEKCFLISLHVCIYVLFEVFILYFVFLFFIFSDLQR
jgi:hypothetical protein